MEGGGGGEKRERLPASPTILENAPLYFTVRLICKLTARQNRSMTNRLPLDYKNCKITLFSNKTRSRRLEKLYSFFFLLSSQLSRRTRAQKTKNLTLWVKSAIQQSNFCNVQNLILPRIEKEPEKKKKDKGKKLAECRLIQNSLRASISPDSFPALFDTWVCFQRGNKMSAPSTPRGRKRSRASPPRMYFTMI